MPAKVAPLQLPAPTDAAQSSIFRRLTLWSTSVTQVINSLGAANYGKAATSGIATLTFAGANAQIAIGQSAHFVAGGTSLQKIVAPAAFTGLFCLIPTTVFALVSGGNIVVPGSSASTVVNEMIPMFYDGMNWYMSHV